jgi:hypothetical protein
MGLMRQIADLLCAGSIPTMYLWVVQNTVTSLSQIMKLNRIRSYSHLSPQNLGCFLNCPRMKLFATFLNKKKDKVVLSSATSFYPHMKLNYTELNFSPY